MTAPTIGFGWKPPGPVAQRCHLAAPPMGGVQLLNGPVGSGKTTERLIKGLTLAAKQAPSPRRTVKFKDPGTGRIIEARPRMVKMCCVRDNYRQLWRSTLPSWWKRVPKEAGEWVGADNGPASHRQFFDLGDGTIVDFQADFIAIGENAVEDVMRGYEPTFWYLNELDLLAEEVLTYARGRAGRYPDIADGGPTWYGVLADCNAPEFENWLYTRSEIDEATGKRKKGIFQMTPAELEAEGVQLFIQPGGRSPQAENLDNLPQGYYVTQCKGAAQWYVSRMVDNRPGYSRSGKPVHPEFNQHQHVAKDELEPENSPLVIGFDPRTIPSAIFMQRRPNGQRRIVDELQGAQNMGPRRFGKLVAQLLHDRYPFLRPGSIRGMCDPSAQYGADKEDGEQPWIEIVAEIVGIRIDPAPSNNIDVRREALKTPLGQLIDGEPALLISPRCATTIAGLNSGFRYREIKMPGGGSRHSDEVEKNHYADVCEAAEYACLSDGAELEIFERREAQMRSTSQRTAQDDWQPFGGSR
jgi:hypothetical protein